MTDNKDKPATPPSPDLQQADQLDLFAAQYSAHFVSPILKNLARRLPYMFTQDNVGLILYTGWYPVFEGLCVAIDARLGESKRGFHWLYLHEAFGNARWNWELDGVPAPHIDVDLLGNVMPPSVGQQGAAQDEMRVAIVALVAKAADQARFLCMACGTPAPWMRKLALCERHEAVFQQDTAAVWRLAFGNTRGTHG